MWVSKAQGNITGENYYKVIGWVVSAKTHWVSSNYENADAPRGLTMP